MEVQLPVVLGNQGRPTTHRSTNRRTKGRTGGVEGKIMNYYHREFTKNLLEAKSVRLLVQMHSIVIDIDN